MNKEEVVFKRSSDGMLTWFAGMIVFVFGGILMVNSDEVRNRVIGVISIMLFGGVGLFTILFRVLWQPIVSISNEGVKVYPRAKKEQFITWSNVKRVEIVTQRVGVHKQKFVGVFAIDDTLVEGASGSLLKGATKLVTGWREVPALLISPYFSDVTHDEILDVLIEFHQAYQESEAWMYESYDMS